MIVLTHVSGIRKYSTASLAVCSTYQTFRRKLLQRSRNNSGPLFVRSTLGYPPPAANAFFSTPQRVGRR